MDIFKIELGATVTDRITGFTGIVTGRAEYISGCRQYAVAPKVKGNAKAPSEWFDEDRLLSGKGDTGNRGGPQGHAAPLE